MGYREVVQKIKGSLKYGDVNAIVNKAGCSRPIFESAVKKNDWIELTKTELDVIGAAVDYLNEREASLKKQRENIGRKIAERAKIL